MRLLYAWIAALIFATSCIAQSAQDDQATTTATSTGDEASLTTSISSNGTPTVDNSITSSTPTQTSSIAEESQSLTESAAPTLSPTPTPTGNSTSATSSSATATISPTQNALPIQPTITPAIGIAGVILLIGGLVLCFVGIKNRYIQIFLSTSFLVALSIEVLIVYVMDPPVSNAVQGGYLVAGVVGGAIIGGIAVIFKEVTEGLGCVLGGFCFAMWLLVLAPGGTIKSNTGRIVLIAIFCVACFALSFSRYTRHYGVMICTSFSGATIFILGIDCFSSAGLKEFWLYLWNLNPAEFPLGTNTYPSTRYIRVEVALNVIVAVLGVLSQIKLWKIIREKRVQKDAERLEDEENRDQFETAVARNLEARNRRERAHWEGTYGDKDGAHVHVDSALGSSIDDYSKGSSEVREHEIEAIELSEVTHFSKRTSDFDSNAKAKRRSVPGEAKSQERLIGPGSSTLMRDTEFQPASYFPAHKTLKAQYNRPSWTGVNQKPVDNSQIDSAHGKANELGQPESAQRDERLSTGESSHIHDRRGIAVEQLSLHPESDDGHDNDEIPSPLEDDRESSVAATAAEDPDLDALSDASDACRAPSPYNLSSGRNSALQLQAETPLEEDDEEILQRPINPSVPASRRSSSASTNNVKEQDASAEDATSYIADDSSSKVNLSEHLPRKLSRATSQYRTTEWAKEAGRAEPEPIEEIDDGTLDAVRVDLKSAAEAARAEENNASKKQESPEHVDEQSTKGRSSQRESLSSSSVDAATTQPLEIPTANRESSQSLSKNPYRQSINLSRQSLNLAPVPVYAHSANPANPPLQRAGSNSSQFLMARRSSNPIHMAQSKMAVDGSRNVTAPIVSQTLVESPTEDSLNPTSPPRQLSTASSNPNLLEVRENKLKERVTSTSFNAVPTNASTPNLHAHSDQKFIAGDIDSSSGPFGDFASIGEEEEMTLAERKALVKEQVRRQSGSGAVLSRPPSMHRLSQPNMHNWPLVDQPPMPTQLPQQLVRMNSNSQLIYDSHQPRRTSTFDQAKAGQNWSIWQSQKAVAVNQRTAMMSTDGQMDMLRQQRAQQDFEARQRAEQQQAVQAQMDIHMRMGGMHDAHRNALSRMQSQANKNASAQGAL